MDVPWWFPQSTPAKAPCSRPPAVSVGQKAAVRPGAGGRSPKRSLLGGATAPRGALRGAWGSPLSLGRDTLLDLTSAPRERARETPYPPTSAAGTGRHGEVQPTFQGRPRGPWDSSRIFIYADLLSLSRDSHTYHFGPCPTGTWAVSI